MVYSVRFLFFLIYLLGKISKRSFRSIYYSFVLFCFLFAKSNAKCKQKISKKSKKKKQIASKVKR